MVMAKEGLRGGKMNKKLFLVIVICVAIASIISAWLYLKRATIGIPKKIVIGWPVPITGPIATFGESDPWLAAYITKIVNEDKGGVYISKYKRKIPIEILIRDTQSDEGLAASIAKDLIVDEKIDVMMVLHTPSTTVPVSSVCEKYKVPCVVFDTPVLSWLTGAPYEWSYLHFWTEPDVAAAYVGMWNLIGTNKKVGGLWNNDSDGKTFREATIAEAEKYGYDFVGDEGFSPYGLEDYSAYINDWKRKGVEILAGLFIPPDFATLWRQCEKKGFRPKVVTIGRGILFPSTMEELGGDLPLGLTTEIWWSKYHPATSLLTGLTPAELADIWENESGKQWTQPLFYSMGALETVIDVLGRAGGLSREEIRQAIADTELDTIVGKVCFKTPLSAEDKKRYEKWPQLIKYKSHYSPAPVVGGQWMKGRQWPWEIKIVYNGQYYWIPKTDSIIILNEQQKGKNVK
jgi:branched-chain amino acid transport system substrate-binding protein